jgi:hypothetical protein
LVGSLVAVAPGKILADLDALSQRLGLPMKFGQELLSSLGAQGFPGGAGHLQEVLNRLDPSSTIAIVWVLPQKSAAKGYCAALTFKSPQAARQTLDELGTAGAERNGVVERRVSTGDVVWGGLKGRTLFVSGSAEALLFAGALAETAQLSPPSGQMVFTVLPQALAKASGKASAAIVAQIQSAMAAAAATAQDKAALQRAAMSTVEAAVRLALESSAFHLDVEVGPRDGLALRAELVPAPATDFAKACTARAPYAFDASLPVADDTTAVFSLGDLWPLFTTVGPIIEASGPSGRAFWRDLTKFSAATTGFSCAAESGGSVFRSLCSSVLRPGVSARTALDAVVAMSNSQHAWQAEIEGRKVTSPLKIKRSRDVVEIEMKIENIDPTARALAKALAGGDSAKYAFAVKGGRLVSAWGRKPREVLGQYGTANNLKNAPLVATTLAKTSGAEGVASVDVIAFALRLLATGNGLPGGPVAAMAGSLPGVADMKAPFVFALRSGNALSGEFHIPLGSLDSIGRVVRGVLGAVAPSP